MTCLGIDLGTTNSCVALYHNNVVKNLEISPNNKLIPSVVSFTEEQVLIGDDAKANRNINPSNTISSVKRLIGRNYNENSVQNDLNANFFPYKVIENPQNKNAAVEVRWRGKNWIFSPEEIDAFILSYLKTIIEKNIKHHLPYRTVISVPAYFNSNQRKSTIAAAKIAGFKKIDLINEPTAAAISYFMSAPSILSQKSNILVFDFGGGTLDVSIIEKVNETYNVKACAGDMHLGGDDFDKNLFEYLKEIIHKRMKVDITDMEEEKMRLREECEKTKRILSESKSAEIYLDNFVKDKPFKFTLSRNYFEELNKDLFSRLLNPVKDALEKAKLTPQDINLVLLVGGSTRIPKIKEILEKFFPDQLICESDNQEYAVSQGSAYYAAKLEKDELKEIMKLDEQNLIPKHIREMKVNNTCSLTIGIETKDHVMQPIFESGTPIPVEKEFEFCTTKDKQDSAKISIFEGESKVTTDNTLLSTLHIYQIPPAPAGYVHFKIHMKLQENGVLTYKIEVLNNEKQVLQSFKEQIETSQLSETDINEKHQLLAEKYKEDSLVADISKRKNHYSGYFYSIKRLLRDRNFIKSKRDSQINEIQKVVDEGLTLLNGFNVHQDILSKLTKECDDITEQFHKYKDRIEKIVVDDRLINVGFEAEKKDLFSNIIHPKSQNQDDLINLLIKSKKNDDPDINKSIIDEEGKTSLHIASIYNNIDFIKALLTKENLATININIKDMSGYTPLHYACQSCNSEIVDFLIHCGCDINCLTDYDQNPLHIICIGPRENNDLTISNSKSIISNLIDNGCDVHKKDKFQKEPIHYATENDIVSFLKKFFRKQIDFNTFTDENKNTLLHYAIIQNSLNCVKFLIENHKSLQINIESRNANNMTPLFLAVYHNRYDIVPYLLTQKININAGTILETPLQCAIKKQYTSIISLLEQNSAKIKNERKKPKDFVPNIFQACRENNIKSVQYLIEKLHVDKDLKGENQITPLHCASCYNNLDVVRYLIEKHEADKEAKDSQNKTPLFYACKEGHLIVVKYLIEDQNVDKEIKDSQNKTPLFYAFQNNHSPVVDYLMDQISKSKNLNILHFACQYNDIELVKYLITEKNYDKELPDNSLRVPLHFATIGGHLDICKYLIEDQHAYYYPIDINKKTLLHYACENGFLPIVKYFFEKKPVPIDPVDSNNNTPFMLAFKNNHNDIVQYIAQWKKLHPKHVEVQSLPDFSKMVEEPFEPDIIKAISSSKLESFKYLYSEQLDKPIDLSKYNGNSFLHMACEHQDSLDIVKYLFSFSNVDVESKNDLGQTPLHISCKVGNYNTVQYLIEKVNAFPIARDNNNSTPMHLACENNHVDIVEFLKAHAPDSIYYKDKQNRIPYDIAEEKNSKELMNIVSPTPKVDAINMQESEYEDDESSSSPQCDFISHVQ